MSDSEMPGWDAIDEVVGRVYPDQKPMHYGTATPYFLGGKDPLVGISAYSNSTDGVAWWHFVTYGYSELFEKESDDPDQSGFGFEMTLRLVKQPGEDEPPMWAMSFLQNIATYVFETGNAFAEGHHMDVNGPIALESETELTAIILTEDDMFRPINSPNGWVRFLQMVGITEDERIAAISWDAGKFLDAVRTVNPMLLTDIGRRSYMTDPKVAQLVEEGVQRDGSSCGLNFFDQLSVSDDGDRKVITIGALYVDTMVRTLPNRLLFGREFGIIGDELAILFLPENTSDEGGSIQGDEDGEFMLELQLTDEQVRRIADTVQPKQGDYEISDRLTLRVVPTDIHDVDGEVIRVVG